jgi:serine kinase of HPr protein (carbohydrate metabolism regulator)
MTMVSSETLHASCVAIDGRAVLIEGRSGSGKSDLALRLIDRGARLVSDDYTVVVRERDRLLAQPPATIAGRIEVRGLGIVEMPHAERVAVALVVRLADQIERMPAEDATRTIAGIAVPSIALAGHEASAPIKVGLALTRLAG